MTFSSRRTAALIAALLTTLISAPLLAATPETNDEKAFYSIGATFAQQLTIFEPMSPKELDILILGLRDTVKGNTLAVDQEQGAALVRTLVQERKAKALEIERVESVKFATAEAKKKGAKITESGLVYREITAGSGVSPTATQTVSVHYHGTLRDGTVFDSSVERGQPAEFPLNRVIPCWTEGVAMMKVGGKSMLICPADIAYGDKGSPPRIKGGATLAFEVELLEIK